MFGLKAFLMGLFLGTGGMLLAMQFHLVRSSDGFTVIPRKHQPPLRSTYVDVRRWSVAHWRRHPEVGEALVRSGRPDLIIRGAVENFLPEQSETRSESVTDSVGERTKKAVEALVPIRFTNQPGDLETRETPEPVEAFKVPLGPRASQVPQIVRRENSEGERRRSGLPVSELPVSSESRVDLSAGGDPGEAQTSLQQEDPPPADWVRGLLRALIPQGDEAAVPTEHSHARLPFELRAPLPGEEVLPDPPSSPQVPFQMPGRMVRPF